MRKVFEPSNALEGHMLQDLLKQRGISSRLDGEHLQSAVGEIPVTGFVRLMVEDSDYAAARSVIDEWESAAVTDPIPVPEARIPWVLVALLLGLAVGIGGSYLYYRVPANLVARDNNEDGRYDEHWTYSPSGALVRGDQDRNFDGKMDSIYQLDREGGYDSGKDDEDFDGTYETLWKYADGRMASVDVDADQDGVAELHTEYRNGVPHYSEFFVPDSDRPARVEYYLRGRLTYAEVDTDGDGRLDTRKNYSELAEVTGTEAITSSQ